MKTKALLIDIDGTLLDFRQAEIRGIDAVMEHYGVSPDEEKEKRYHEINQLFWQKYERGEITRVQINEGRYPAFFGEMGVSADWELCERLYREQVDSLIILVDGAEETLRYLAENYLLYAASNGYSKSQRERLEKAGLLGYFQDVFVSEETGSQKPQKEFFDYCFARMPEGIRPEEVMILGDGLTSDMAGGNRVGIRTCWYNAFGEKNDVGASIDHEIHHLYEIRKIL